MATVSFPVEPWFRAGAAVGDSAGPKPRLQCDRMSRLFAFASSPSGRSVVLIAACALGAAGSAVAQVDPPAVPRRPTFVRVLGPDGVPVAGAEVTFAGGNPALDERVLRPDVQVVASDARGRARARLLPGLCYVAWAVAPLPGGAAGEVLFAPTSDYFGAGALLELRCERQSAVEVTHDWPDAELWADHGPLTISYVTPRPGVERVLGTADGWLRPPIDDAFAELRGGQGELLASQSSGGHLLLHAPAELTVRAIDETGAPVVGARVQWKAGARGSWSTDAWREPPIERLRDVGVTGADGRVTVVVPSPTNPLRTRPSAVAPMMLYVDAPGRARVGGGSRGRVSYRDDQRIKKHDADELVFTLPRVELLRSAPRSAPPGSVAQLVAKCKLRAGASYRHDPRTFFATADDDGVLTFDHVPDDVHSLRLIIVPSDGAPTMVFEALAGRTFPPDLSPALLANDDGPPRLGTLNVQAFDPSGGPARGAVVTVVSAGGDLARQRDSAFRLALDSAGRGAVRLGRGRWVAVTLSPAGHDAQEFSIDAHGAEVQLRLSPLGTMPVELRGDDGEPVADARIRVAGSRASASESALQRVQHMLAERLAKDWQSLRTDERGRLDLPFLPLETLEWRAKLARSGAETGEFEVAARERPLVLRLR